MRIFSIGHGTRSFDELLATLASGPATQVLDVRSFPGSRRHPQFGRAELERTLPAAGLAYHWLPALGGRRRSDPRRSLHPAWRVDAFRAYADHTDTPEFARGLAELLERAAASPRYDVGVQVDLFDS